MADTESEVLFCPFCGSAPTHLELPGADAFGCQSCGAIGPPEMGEPGPERFQRALRSFNRRGGVGHVRVAHVAAGITPGTAAIAEVFAKTATKIMENEFGPVDRMVCLLLDSVTNRLGVIRHNMDDPNTVGLLRATLEGLLGRRQMEAAHKGGLILPPGARV